MRETRVIIPVAAFSGEEHYVMRMALAEQFGGYTCVLGAGGWMDPVAGIQTEEVYVYDIATDGHYVRRLRDFAMWVALRGKQASVYFRTPSGEVELVTGEREKFAIVPWLDRLDGFICKYRLEDELRE